MKMQNNVLKQYREIYSNYTLKDISEQTGIQISRVFRLFNGAEMKVSELEIFQNILETHTTQSYHFLSIAKKCLDILSPETIDKINYEMQMLLNLKEQSCVFPIFNSQEIRA